MDIKPIYTISLTIFFDLLRRKIMKPHHSTSVSELRESLVVELAKSMFSIDRWKSSFFSEIKHTVAKQQHGYGGGGLCH